MIKKNGGYKVGAPIKQDNKNKAGLLRWIWLLGKNMDLGQQDKNRKGEIINI